MYRVYSTPMMENHVERNRKIIWKVVVHNGLQGLGFQENWGASLLQNPHINSINMIKF